MECFSGDPSKPDEATQKPFLRPHMHSRMGCGLVGSTSFTAFSDAKENRIFETGVGHMPVRMWRRKVLVNASGDHETLANHM